MTHTQTAPAYMAASNKKCPLTVPLAVLGEVVRQLEFLRAYKDDLPTLRIESTIADRHYTTFWISHYRNGGRP